VRNWDLELRSKKTNKQTKYRNRINATPDLRIQLSNIKLNKKRICEEKIKTAVSTTN
jgi:hypothetical protein